MSKPNSPRPADRASELVDGDRQSDYGHPYANFDRIAKGWSVIFGCDVTPEQAAMAMIWLKIAREVHKRTEDNLTDLYGYVKVLDMIYEWKDGHGAS